jgi:hypothetical protein
MTLTHDIIMSEIHDLIFEEINNNGYMLLYNIPNKVNKEIFKLIESGVLVQLSKIPETAKFMNSSYKVTYADNRFNLKIYSKSNNSWIGKGKKHE